MSSKHSFAPNKSAKKMPALPLCKSQIMPVMKKDNIRRKDNLCLEEIQRKLAEETSGNIRALERHVMAIDLQLFPGIKNGTSVAPYSIRVSQKTLQPNPTVVVSPSKITPTLPPITVVPNSNTEKENTPKLEEIEKPSSLQRENEDTESLGRPRAPWRSPSCNLSLRKSFNKSIISPSTTVTPDVFYQRLRANAIRHSVPPPRGVSLSTLTTITKSSLNTRSPPAYGRHAIISAARLSSTGISLNNKYMSAPHCSTSPTGELSDKRQLMRMMVTQELLSTERDYINDLILTTELFYIPLRERQLLKERHIQLLFSNMTMLLGLNTEMLEALENTTEIGQVFCTMFDFLKMYSIYCNNLPEAFKALDVYKKKFPRFEAFLQEQISNPQLRSLPLDGYLIKPIQRIMKYPLLIKELKKYTDTTNSDFKKLDKAETKIQSILETINENKRKYEDYEQVKLLQKRIVSGEKQELTRSEKIILHDKVRETEIIDDVEVNPGAPKIAHYYLFNNALARFIKRKGLLKSSGDLRLIAYIPLSSIRDIVDVRDKRGADGFRNGFEFTYDLHGKNTRCKVQMSTSQKKQEILKYLEMPHPQYVQHVFTPY